jgi:hypothetical protein
MPAAIDALKTLLRANVNLQTGDFALLMANLNVYAAGQKTGNVRDAI